MWWVEGWGESRCTASSIIVYHTTIASRLFLPRLPPVLTRNIKYTRIHALKTDIGHIATSTVALVSANMCAKVGPFVTNPGLRCIRILHREPQHSERFPNDIEVFRRYQYWDSGTLDGPYAPKQIKIDRVEGGDQPLQACLHRVELTFWNYANVNLPSGAPSIDTADEYPGVKTVHVHVHRNNRPLMSVGLRREQCILYICRQNAVENARNHAVGLATHCAMTYQLCYEPCVSD
jgi:hypothetical protein